MAEVFLQITPAHISYATQMLGGLEKDAGMALRTAGNETLRKFRTELVKLIGTEHLAKKSEIRERVYISQGFVGSKLQGAVSVNRHQVPLDDFKIRFSKKAGAAVQMLASSPLQRFQHAFKAKMKSGHVGAFQRVKGAMKTSPDSGTYAKRILKRGPRKGLYMLRQPIKELFGVPVVRTFEIKPQIQQQATQNLAATFDKSLKRKIDWILSKRK